MISLPCSLGVHYYARHVKTGDDSIFTNGDVIKIVSKTVGQRGFLF